MSSPIPQDEKRLTWVPNEKHDPVPKPASKNSLDLSVGDEALKLVGARRIAEFSEEYNLKLRRKLVGMVQSIVGSTHSLAFR